MEERVGVVVACLLTKVQLLDRIEGVRERMIIVAESQGLTSEESLKLSHELDELINTYHKQNANQK